MSKFLKITAIIIGCLIVIAGVVFWGFCKYLSPDNITKLIEEKSSEYLKAEIKIGKLDYKLFSTYPWLQFEIDSLYVISKSLNGISNEVKLQLPRDADSLVSVRALQGKINIHDLIRKKINLKDIEIDKPWVNIVMVNDSTTNFNIVPNISKPTKLPQFEISEINVDAPVIFEFFSLQKDIESTLDIEEFYLTKDNDNFYNIGFEGLADGRYQQFSLPESIPIKIITTVKPDFPELSLWLKDLSLLLSGVSLQATGEINLNKSILDLNKATLNLKVEDVFTLIKAMPKEISQKIALPKGITGSLPFQFVTTLTSPFKINLQKINELSLENVPSLTTSFTIEKGELEFTPPKGKKIYADNIKLDISCNYDPTKPDETTLIIRNLSLYGEGVSLYSHSEINNLTGEEQIITGELDFQTSLMKSLSYLLPKSAYKINGHLKGKIDFSGLAMNLGKNGVKNIKLCGEIESKTLDINTGSNGTVKLKRAKSDYKVQIPQYPLSDYSGTKLAFKLISDSITANNSLADIILSGLSLNIDAMDTVSGNPNPNGVIALQVNSLQANSGSDKYTFDTIDLKIKGSLNQNGQSKYSPIAIVQNPDDKLIESRIKHTPLLLEYNGGSPLQTIMNMMTMDLDLKVAKGKVNTQSYLIPIEIAGLELYSNLNKIKAKVNNIQLGRSKLSLLGEFKGLLPYMTSYSATPLETSADIHFSDVDINELSWGYYGALVAQGKDSVFYVSPMTPFKASDSICVVIPRNITADIRLQSDSARYMQYKFSPLSTDILIENGEATLRDLTIGTPYCTTKVNWTYSTSQLDNIFMNISANVDDFNFIKFYNVFPSLIEKMPEIRNLSGEIEVNLGCNFRMFPDMFMDSQSLKGNFNIKSENIEFARNGKIEKITHLMLIEGDKPIKLQNLDIYGGYHDNLLQVNPFKICFDGYQLQVGGVNNIDGEMYYHLALEKSPFHLPFGVSVFGKMKHPEYRVGGTHIDDYRSEMVGAEVESRINANIMAYLSHGWLLFIQEAAKYEGIKLQSKD